jgi:hypothetical protein
MLTLTTAGPLAALLPPAREHNSGLRLALGLMLPAMLLGGAGLTKSNPRKLLGFCLLFLVLGASLLQMGCGGGSTPPANTGNPGTPAGTYTVTVTGSANGMASQTASVLVMVQ